MGLSDDERRRKILWAVHRITELAKELGTAKEYPRKRYEYLKELCGSLWFELWGKQGNSAFWIVGSNEDVYEEAEDIWGYALYQKIKAVDSENHEYTKSILDNYLEMPEILNSLSPRDEKVYRIYEWIQQIQYAANRYSDETADKYKGIMEICAKIYGECFAIFQKIDDYAMAYILSEISKILYKECSPRETKSWDTVTKYLIDDNAHHYIKSPYNSSNDKLKSSKYAWKSLHQDDSQQNRLYIFLELSEENCDFKWKEVMKIVSKYRWDKRKFGALMKKNQELKEKKERNTSDYKRERDEQIKDLLDINKN